MQSGGSSLSSEQLGLLTWILSQGQVVVELQQAQDGLLREILAGSPTVMMGKVPKLFKVDWRGQRRSTAAFDQGLEQFGSFTAFHGTSMENLYSVLHNGLTNHLTKATNLFGEGIYFSTDVNVAMSFSKRNQGWRKSVFGQHATCVLVVDIVRHPSIRTKDNPGQ